MGENNMLLVYQSKLGSTRQAAVWIAEGLPGCEAIDLGIKGAKADPANYGTVIIGTGILMGKAFPRIRDFIKRHRTTLLQKDLAIFITHLEAGEAIEKDFTDAFDSELLAHARVRAGVGGRLKLKNLNVILRGVMRKIGDQKGIDLTNYDTLSRESCLDFALKVQARD